VRGYAFVNCVRICAVREADTDISVFEPETGINVRGDFVIGLEDVFDIDIDEVVERIDVLFHEPFYLEKGGQQQPFILLGLSL
jgi:hypothetical protein